MSGDPIHNRPQPDWQGSTFDPWTGTHNAKQITTDGRNTQMKIHEQIQRAEDEAMTEGDPDAITRLANLARDLARLVGDLDRELREARAHGESA